MNLGVATLVIRRKVDDAERIVRFSVPRRALYRHPIVFGRIISAIYDLLGRDPETIFNSLRNMVAVAQEHGAETVLTINGKRM